LELQDSPVDWTYRPNNREAHKAMKFLLDALRSKPISEQENIRREWDKQRSLAMSPSHLAEIDAIFARHV
jgi:hypothetical protein